MNENPDIRQQDQAEAWRGYSPDDARADAMAKAFAALAAGANPTAWAYWDIGGGQSAACPECIPAALAQPDNGPPAAIQNPTKGDTCESCGRVA